MQKSIIIVMVTGLICLFAVNVGAQNQDLYLDKGTSVKIVKKILVELKNQKKELQKELKEGKDRLKTVKKVHNNVMALAESMEETEKVENAKSLSKRSLLLCRERIRVLEENIEDINKLINSYQDLLYSLQGKHKI